MGLAFHSWRRVPKTLKMLSRLSWLWPRPSRTGTTNTNMIDCSFIILTLLEIGKIYNLLTYFCCSQDGQPTSCSQCKATDSADPWAACRPEDLLLLVLRCLWFCVNSTCYDYGFCRQIYLHYSFRTPFLIASFYWSDD
jgi:hypothetical protein